MHVLRRLFGMLTRSILALHIHAGRRLTVNFNGPVACTTNVRAGTEIFRICQQLSMVEVV
jgi:hypothetical protein